MSLLEKLDQEASVSEAKRQLIDKEVKKQREYEKLGFIGE